MHDEDIVDPIPCPAAFREGGEAASYSQAALLLALGIAMKREYAPLLTTLAEQPPFPLPELPSVVEAISEEHFERVLSQMTRQTMDGTARRVQLSAAEDLYRNAGEQRNVDSALRLLAASMRAPGELARVAAAVSTLDLVDTPMTALRILVNAALRSRSDLVRGIATSALVRVERDLRRWPRLARQLVRIARSRAPFRWHSHVSVGSKQTLPTNNTACLVHGTLLVPVGKRPEEWWKPGTGDFHQYLRTGPRPNVYSGSDYFYWSGGWSDDARSDAVEGLCRWVRSHRDADLDLFAHSHGANVAMLASHHVKIRQLVLLSCPVHWGLYRPDFFNVRDIVSIRVRWDLIIMADRADQRFQDPRIREHVLPVWYGRHDSSRRSSTWRSHDLVQHLDSPAISKQAAPPTPPPRRPLAPAFQYVVRIKGPVERATAVVQALRAHSLIGGAHFQQVLFKNSPPRPHYDIEVVAKQALTAAWIRDVAQQSNAELVGFARYTSSSAGAQ